MPSIRDEFGRILDLRWSLARDQCASQPICALRVGPNRGKTPKSCPFKNEGIPETCRPTIPCSHPTTPRSGRRWEGRWASDKRKPRLPEPNELAHRMERLPAAALFVLLRYSALVRATCAKKAARGDRLGVTIDTLATYRMVILVSCRNP